MRLKALFFFLLVQFLFTPLKGQDTEKKSDKISLIEFGLKLQPILFSNTYLFKVDLLKPSSLEWLISGSHFVYGEEGGVSAFIAINPLRRIGTELRFGLKGNSFPEVDAGFTYTFSTAIKLFREKRDFYLLFLYEWIDFGPTYPSKPYRHTLKKTIKLKRAFGGGVGFYLTKKFFFEVFTLFPVGDNFLWEIGLGTSYDNVTEIRRVYLNRVINFNVSYSFSLF